jgi:hypothetical protein
MEHNPGFNGCASTGQVEVLMQAVFHSLPQGWPPTAVRPLPLGFSEPANDNGQSEMGSETA